MSVADLIPNFTDAELASLNANVRRIGDTGTPAQKAQAAELAPLIEAQIADRLARKPVKAKAKAKPRVAAAPKEPKVAKPKKLSAAAARAAAAAAEAAETEAAS